MRYFMECKHWLLALLLAAGLCGTAGLVSCGGGSSSPAPGLDAAQPGATGTDAPGPARSVSINDPPYFIFGLTRKANSEVVPGVTVSFSGGYGTITTDKYGQYKKDGFPPGTYTITPSKAGFIFSPASKTVPIIDDDLSYVNFIAIPVFSISGRTRDNSFNGVSGVLLQFSNGYTATSNSNGDYTRGGFPGGDQPVSYTVTPSKSGWTFTPLSKTVSISNQNAVGINFIGSVVNQDAYEADNTWGMAKTVTPLDTFTSQSRTIHAHTDDDWVQFQAYEHDMYTFQTTGTLDTYAGLYNSSGSQLAHDDNSNGGGNFRIIWTCQNSGTYFLKVHHRMHAMSGPYTLQFKDAGDSWEDDDNDGQVSKRTVFSYREYEAHTLHVGADQDWMAFDLQAGVTYDFGSTGSVDTSAELYRANGTLITYDYSAGNFHISFVPDATATYRLKIFHSAGPLGNYSSYYQYF